MKYFSLDSRAKPGNRIINYCEIKKSLSGIATMGRTERNSAWLGRSWQGAPGAIPLLSVPLLTAPGHTTNSSSTFPPSTALSSRLIVEIIIQLLIKKIRLQKSLFCVTATKYWLIYIITTKYWYTTYIITTEYWHTAFILNGILAYCLYIKRNIGRTIFPDCEQIDL